MRGVGLSSHDSGLFSSSIATPQRHEQQQKYPTIDHSSSEPSASSSFASLMPSPIASRLSFQTFTNFIPLSWSPRSKIETPLAALAIVEESDANNESRGPQKRGYVSKEVQLEKLKARLLREQDMTRNVADVCKKCNEDEAVHL